MNTQHDTTTRLVDFGKRLALGAAVGGMLFMGTPAAVFAMPDPEQQQEEQQGEEGFSSAVTGQDRLRGESFRGEMSVTPMGGDRVAISTRMAFKAGTVSETVSGRRGSDGSIRASLDCRGMAHGISGQKLGTASTLEVSLNEAKGTIFARWSDAQGNLVRTANSPFAPKPLIHPKPPQSQEEEEVLSQVQEAEGLPGGPLVLGEQATEIEELGGLDAQQTEEDAEVSSEGQEEEEDEEGNRPLANFLESIADRFEGLKNLFARIANQPGDAEAHAQVEELQSQITEEVDAQQEEETVADAGSQQEEESAADEVTTLPASSQQTEEDAEVTTLPAISRQPEIAICFPQTEEDEVSTESQQTEEDAEVSTESQQTEEDAEEISTRPQQEVAAKPGVLERAGRRVGRFFRNLGQKLQAAGDKLKAAQAAKEAEEEAEASSGSQQTEEEAEVSTGSQQTEEDAEVSTGSQQTEEEAEAGSQQQEEE